MMVIMGIAVDRRAPPGFAGLVIGLPVGGVITTTGNIAGASLNTARTFGPYLIHSLLCGPHLCEHFPLYILEPMLSHDVSPFFHYYIT